MAYTVLDKQLNDILLGQYVSEQVGYIDSNFKALGTSVETLDDKITTVKNEAHKSVSYESIDAMVDAVKALGNDAFNVADNIFIVATDVPDFWISEIKTTAVTNVTAADVAGANYSNVQVGYYVLNKLETQKVDITNAVTTDETALTANNILLGNGNKKLKNSSKSIVTTMDGLDTSVPTSKAVETRLTSVQSSLNSSINNIINGTTTVAKATTATKLGSSTVGSSTKPIYLSSGTATEGSTYAGGTAVTLNGSSKSASTASFYAPTTAGTSGQLLESSGSSAPTWVNPSSLTVGSATKATQDASGNVITSTYATKSELEEVANTAGKIDSITFVTSNTNTEYAAPITDKVAKPKVTGSGVDIVMNSTDGIKIKTKASNTVGSITVNDNALTYTTKSTSDGLGGTYASVNIPIVSGDTETTSVTTGTDGTTTITALGKVRDVTVNGSSVVESGTAAITIDELEGDIINVLSSDTGTWDGTTISKWSTYSSSGTSYYAIQIPINYATTFEVYAASNGKAIVTQNIITSISSGTVIYILVGTTKDSVGYTLRKVKGNAVSTSGSSKKYLYTIRLCNYKASNDYLMNATFQLIKVGGNGSTYTSFDDIYDNLLADGGTFFGWGTSENDGAAKDMPVIYLQTSPLYSDRQFKVIVCDLTQANAEDYEYGNWTTWDSKTGNKYCIATAIEL